MFGEALRVARLEAGLSQNALATQMVGWRAANQSVISAWETAAAGIDVPGPLEVFRLEAELGVAAGSLSAHLGFVPASSVSSVDAAIEAAVASGGLSLRQARVLRILLDEFRSDQ